MPGSRVAASASARRSRLCEDVRQRHPQRRLLLLLVHCRNRAGIATYRKAGFVDTGELFGGGRAGPQHLMLRSRRRGRARPWDNRRMDDHRRRFLDLALRVQALRFGAFTLKSGRSSPVFLQRRPLRLRRGAGRRSPPATPTRSTQPASQFDLLFGPAYKGIPLATALACEYAARGRDLPLAFNRKEAKAHGEGGTLIGAPLAGRRVLIVDDVITAGTAIREALAIIRDVGGMPAGIVIALDRQEVVDPRCTHAASAAQAVAAEHGIPVIAVATLADLLAFAGESAELVAHRDAPARLPRALRMRTADARPAPVSAEQGLQP